MTVVHRPRVALEGARAFVAAASSEVYWWLTDMTGTHLGVLYQLRLAETRLRLQREDAEFTEIGAWRVRLEDLLHERPDLAPFLLRLTGEISERLPR
ncbi:hypothetical protein [Planomonospora venezuelensis]|uniref:Uncharacterized protein n=1 Tax=Planomonospora venezuelensis TaxID=1999 RepID=A0A841D541_PLAVE|nr:hypothetical protein [Planomonospora venezuelensis]MBB5964980.1 hypothetical protein [Planomonospora venezuelensis]GIN05462.1 hypothetical protein Pve01_71200 [Planomonospora venezuelensis]